MECNAFTVYGWCFSFLSKSPERGAEVLWVEWLLNPRCHCRPLQKSISVCPTHSHTHTHMITRAFSFINYWMLPLPSASTLPFMHLFRPFLRLLSFVSRHNYLFAFFHSLFLLFIYPTIFPIFCFVLFPSFFFSRSVRVVFVVVFVGLNFNFWCIKMFVLFPLAFVFPNPCVF